MLLKYETAATIAPIAAAIQPNTGILLIAAPTIRNAPAKVMFAAVPAVAAAACTPVATVFAVCAVVFAPAAAVFAVCAAVFATCAAVSVVVLVVPAANILAHHSFAFVSVTS